MIYADFESILVPEDNETQNLKKSYRKKYQLNIACHYGYILLNVDDKVSKPFRTYLAKDAVYIILLTER